MTRSHACHLSIWLLLQTSCHHRLRQQTYLASILLPSCSGHQEQCIHAEIQGLDGACCIHLQWHVLGQESWGPRYPGHKNVKFIAKARRRSVTALMKWYLWVPGGGRLISQRGGEWDESFTKLSTEWYINLILLHSPPAPSANDSASVTMSLSGRTALQHLTFPPMSPTGPLPCAVAK